MIYTSATTERNAVMRVAELMTAVARTAPKGCAIDELETLILDGEDKDKLTAVMRELGASLNETYFARDAGNVDACHCIVLFGSGVKPHNLDCAFCGKENCAAAVKDNIPCAFSVNDLGIASGSAAATAMDHRIDNRILYTAGIAALKLKLFPDRVKICFGIGLSTSGKNIFFDRRPAK
ncbi:MAG: DUF2148 domain-containing protein [Treponema sp.]|nr:DUF2148 domain-containing protein [Treponema sp.]